MRQRLHISIAVLGKMIRAATRKLVNQFKRIEKILKSKSAQKVSSEKQDLASSQNERKTIQFACARYRQLQSDNDSDDNVNKATVQTAVNKAEGCQIVSKTDECTSFALPEQGKVIAQSLCQIKSEEAVKRKGGGEQSDERPKVPVRFSQEEDICLKNGILRFGYGHWAEILNCKDYSFHERRNSKTLRQRAALRKMKFI